MPVEPRIEHPAPDARSHNPAPSAEQRQKVKDLIAAYVKSGPALAQNAAPETGSAPAATPAAKK